MIEYSVKFKHDLKNKITKMYQIINLFNTLIKYNYNIADEHDFWRTDPCAICIDGTPFLKTDTT